MDGMGICKHMQASIFKNPWSLINLHICHGQICRQIKSSQCAPIGKDNGDDEQIVAAGTIIAQVEVNFFLVLNKYQK